MSELGYEDFRAEHLDDVLRLCSAEGWTSLPEDPERALKAFSAPGVVAVVAVCESAVVGFALMLTDGVLQSYLSDLIVDSSFRGRRVGRRLVEEAFTRSGAKRIDLLALEEAEGFYRSYSHRAFAGYRIFPELGE
jgi:ribosomal protein S18 acetylase RimI-like enzyme